MEKKSKKRDSKGRVKSSNPRLGESSSANNGSNANRELNNVEGVYNKSIHLKGITEHFGLLLPSYYTTNAFLYYVIIVTLFIIETNDMEVPEQLNVATIESEASSSPSTNNQHLSNEYVVPTTRRHVQQQQLLLVKEK